MWNREEVENRRGIYAITNKVTDKKYKGRTNNFHERWNSDYRELRKGVHKNKQLQHDVNKYGIHNFMFEVLEYADVHEMNPLVEDINILELKHIFEYPNADLYNVVTGKNVIAYGIYSRLVDEYEVKIDFKDGDCVSSKNNPLNWNVVVTSYMTGKCAYIQLISPTTRNNTAYSSENIEIRNQFVENHVNYRYVSMDFLIGIEMISMMN